MQQGVSGKRHCGDLGYIPIVHSAKTGLIGPWLGEDTRVNSVRPTLSIVLKLKRWVKKGVFEVRVEHRLFYRRFGGVV